MDKKLEELLKRAQEKENLKKKLISKDEMLEIIKKEHLENFGTTVRF